jgi:RNA polymerase-binding protein DksA
VAKNASTAKAAVEAPARETTMTTAQAAESRRTTGAAAGSDPAPPPARGARGTGAGAKAATGRSTRTSTTAAPATGRRRAPAHTAVADREAIPAGSDWTVEELTEVRTDLGEQLGKLRADYERAIADLYDLQKSSNDGAGDDQADAGSKTFEREQELSIANNRRDLMTQVERALERLDKGTYGRCESCAQPIVKARLQAFPSATLCVKCKQREERR